MSPQSVSFWYNGYFELKLLKKQPVQEGHSDSSSPPEKEEINSPCERYPPCTSRQRDDLITRDREFRARKAV